METLDLLTATPNQLIREIQRLEREMADLKTRIEHEAKEGALYEDENGMYRRFTAILKAIGRPLS